jgi:hypothetical protein
VHGGVFGRLAYVHQKVPAFILGVHVASEFVGHEFLELEIVH